MLRQLPRPNFLEKLMTIWSRVTLAPILANGLAQGVHFLLVFGHDADVLDEGHDTPRTGSLNRDYINVLTPLWPLGSGPVFANRAALLQDVEAEHV